MAKLTLSFRDRKLKVFALDAEDTLIGRDESCAIVIDSLAIEPQHARIAAQGQDFTVSPVSAETPLLVNDQPVNGTQTLRNGDIIRVGKHALHFTTDSTATASAPVASTTGSYGWLQIVSGAHLGRSIRLDKAFTRIGKADDLAVIARRDDGYYLSRLQGAEELLLNGNSVTDQSRKLANGDDITVGALQVQFFFEDSAMENPKADSGHEQQDEQRRFSRIPFDVAATLSSKDRTWETDLLDISLHGALIKIPEGFPAGDDHQPLRLAIHLEGGPDICMDVTIAHREAHELGLNCKDIDVDSITHLRRLVELNLGDAELLERELSALG